MTSRRPKTPTCVLSEAPAASTLRSPERHLLRKQPLGTRVRSRLDGRLALICGSPERARASLALVPVMLEGSTRKELWATHQFEPLPTTAQFRALGGRVKPPAGYPLVPVPV